MPVPHVRNYVSSLSVRLRVRIRMCVRAESFFDRHAADF